MKSECAEAAYRMIRSGMTIGLGKGKIIERLVEFLQMGNMEVKVVTPSMKTALVCRDHNITVVPSWITPKLDIAFDECDQMDQSLTCLKDPHKLHTQEKIMTAMADRYVLFVEESQLVPQLQVDAPVAIEVVPEAFSYIKRQLQQMGAEVAWNMKKDTAVLSYTANPILMAEFLRPFDPMKLNAELKMLPGVIDTSLYVRQPDTAIIAAKDACIIKNRE